VAGYGAPTVRVVRRCSAVRDRAALDDECSRLHRPFSRPSPLISNYRHRNKNRYMAGSCRSCLRRSRLPPTSPSISRVGAASSNASIVRCPPLPTVVRTCRKAHDIERFSPLSQRRRCAPPALADATPPTAHGRTGDTDLIRSTLNCRSASRMWHHANRNGPSHLIGVMVRVEDSPFPST
jgi:hypothetical protein